MPEHKWAPPEHQEVHVYAIESLPLDQIGEPVALPVPEPVWAGPVVVEHGGPIRVKAFAVARSDAGVYMQISWQGRLQRASVGATRRRDAASARPTRPLMGHRRRDRWSLGPALILPEAARGGPDYDVCPPDPVLAWVQFPDRTLEIEAHVIAYTERAVLVEWGFGQAKECAWVWPDAARAR